MSLSIRPHDTIIDEKVRMLVRLLLLNTWTYLGQSSFVTNCVYRITGNDKIIKSTKYEGRKITICLLECNVYRV